MSAPEPQPVVTGPELRMVKSTDGSSYWFWCCEYCGRMSIARAYMTTRRGMRKHGETCRRIADYRRDEIMTALRELIKTWRDHESHETSLVGYAERDNCADELERAIGDGR